MIDAEGPLAPGTAITARQWQRRYGQAAANWIRSSGVAGRMLDDVCQATEATVDRLVGSDGDQAREVIEEFPRVSSSCDQLEFNDVAQALAYLIIHLPDRYYRQLPLTWATAA